jgi:hypothetical protein
MYYRIIICDALRSIWESDHKPGLSLSKAVKGDNSIVSKLIYDIFGGEILKTHKKKGWYFYNMINGERIDFTGSGTEKSSNDNKFEDIPSTSAETSCYFDKIDYSTFFTRFVKIFEETVGLGNDQLNILA